METIGFVQRFASPALDGFMLAVTNLGGERAYIALLVVIYLAFSPSVGRRVGIYLMLSSFLNFHLKGAVGTPRPFMVDASVARSEAAVATAGGAGFPSGHAQGSATFWGYLALRVRRGWFWVLAGVLVALISASRVYLGVHMPVDVVGGVGIAAAVLAFALAADRYAVPMLRSWPRSLVFGLGLLVPLALHLALPVDNSELVMGGLAAFATAPMLIQHHVPAAVWRRAVVAVLGLVVVTATMAGTSVLLSEAVKGDALGGFVRFLLLGYVGLALAPYLARLTGLAPRPPIAADSLADGETP